jgi:hypothetical protein
VADPRGASTAWRAAALVALALIVLLVPTPAAWVDGGYASIYPHWQRAITAAFDWMPVAPFDVWLIAVLVASGVVVRRAWRRGAPHRGRAFAGAAASVLIVASVLYLWFMASWGLNYRRAPLATHLEVDRRRVTPEAVHLLAERTIAELNRLHAPAWAVGWPEWRGLPAMLGPAVSAAARQLGLADGPRPGRPRASLLQPWFRRAAIEGMTDPFLLDVIVNNDLLPMERPAMVAHEWGHLAGFAHEAEASFFGWRVCQAGDARAQYSAWLFVYGLVMQAERPDARAALMAKLEAGPRRDLRDIAARYRQVVPAVRDAAWLAYDRYLKSNRVPEGIASYDDVLILILGGPPSDRGDLRE